MGKKGAERITGFLGLQPPAQFLILLTLGPQAGWSWTLGCWWQHWGAPHCPIMVSALTIILLSCWLAGHSGAWGEPSYPKPNISLSPSGGVSLGGAVAVWCRGQHQGMRFVLNKEGRHFPPVDPKGLEAMFHISNVLREDGGRYNCSYQNRSKPYAASSPSDPVELVVRDPSLPGPSISLSPTGVTAPGADVTIRCRGQPRDVRFFLHKAGDLNPPRHMDPAGDGAEFHIPTVGRQHGGNYCCSYRPRSEPFVSSQPSHPVQLVVAGREFLMPTVWPSTVVGFAGSITIRCEAGKSTWIPAFPAEKPGSERTLETGLACLLEPSYPKPNISLSPSGGVSLGGAVAVWCRGQHQGMRFVLNKEGRHFQTVDPDGLEAVFHISNVSREHGGRYSCSYQNRSKPSAASSPSDPVEMVVRACLLCADPSLPRPSISLSPTGVTAPGVNITIRCRGQRRDVRFFLHKAGDLNPPRHMDPAGDGAEFHIPTVGRQHGGNYSCSYRPRSEPFVSSQPSHPVQLVVADPSLPRPSISLSPTGVTAAGADVTIRCQGPPWDVRFFLHKAGDLNPPRHMDPAGDGAEFHIPTVGRQHGGSYGCSYRPRSEPFVSSQPSHPVQLVVAGGSKSQAPSGLTSPIIAGASAAAAVLLLILLILVAFLCFRKTRDRKEAAPRPRSTIPLRMLKAPAQQDPIYSSVDEGKETQTLPQEPDPGTDGLTYAELDRQALHAKPGGPAPAPEPTQPSVYAAINVSRGAPQ
ncbi:unnamed protein product [Caretta caretta]